MTFGHLWMAEFQTNNHTFHGFGSIRETALDEVCCCWYRFVEDEEIAGRTGLNMDLIDKHIAEKSESIHVVEIWAGRQLENWK